MFSVVPCNDQLWSPGKCVFCRGSTIGKARAVLTVYSFERKRRELLLASDECLIYLTDELAVHGTLRGLVVEAEQSCAPKPGQLAIGDLFRLGPTPFATDRLPNLGPSGKPFDYGFIQPMSNEAMKQFDAERKSKHPEIDKGASRQEPKTDDVDPDLL